jgi:hypothetical protein
MYLIELGRRKFQRQRRVTLSQLGNIIRIRAQEAQCKNLSQAEEYWCRAYGARHSFLDINFALGGYGAS